LSCYNKNQQDMSNMKIAQLRNMYHDHTRFYSKADQNMDKKNRVGMEHNKEKLQKTRSQAYKAWG